MQKNRIELAGYLGGKVSVRYLPSGTPVANVRMAEGYRYTDRNNQPQEHTNWHSLVFYGDLAEIAAGFDKGDNLVDVLRCTTGTLSVVARLVLAPFAK